MGKYFYYQNIWLRMAGFLVIVPLIFEFHTQIIAKSYAGNTLVYILEIITIFLLIVLYYKWSEYCQWYIMVGQYKIKKDKLVFSKNRKSFEIKIDEIDEIRMVKSSFFKSHHILLKIKYADNKLTLISSPISKKTSIYKEDFMDIFNYVKTYSSNLTTVCDIHGNYLYSKNAS